MSGPDRILFVYDAPKFRDDALLGEIREFALHLEAVTIDGRDLGTFVQIPNAASAISFAMRGVAPLPRPAPKARLRSLTAEREDERLTEGRYVHEAPDADEDGNGGAA